MNITINRRILLALTAACGVVVSGTTARAEGCGMGCCAAAPAAEHAAAGDTTGHGNHTATTTLEPNLATPETLQKPAPSILANYAKIETALAGDTLAGVSAAAQAIAKLANDDAEKTLPAEVATQAVALGKAKDLEAARASFKPLSTALISYLDQAKVKTGKYFEVYCPMAQASWLQTDKAVKNPYYGAAMLKCGEIKRAF